jgi:hypothetical protein
MKLTGKLELSYEKNGITFDLKVKIDEKNHSDATELMNILSEYVDDTKKSEQKGECLKRMDAVLGIFDKSLSEAIRAKKDQMRNGSEQPKEEKPAEQPGVTVPKMQFDKTDSNIDIPETLNTQRSSEPVGSFDEGTLSDAEHPSPNHCQQSEIT